MAAVGFTDGSSFKLTGATAETELFLWRSPSSMDSADTVVLPTRTGKTAVPLQCYDETTGDAVTFTLSTLTVTIDAAGGTTNHVYSLLYCYV